MVNPPKLNLGKSRLTLKEEKPGSYEILCSRAREEDRARIKYFVNDLETHVNQEDFFEEVAYRFYIEKPYVLGYNFLFPVNPIAQIRKTNLAVRTGWRQINFSLNAELAQAIREEVVRLQKYNRSISVVSYLYTALRWYLEKLEHQGESIKRERINNAPKELGLSPEKKSHTKTDNIEGAEPSPVATTQKKQSVSTNSKKNLAKKLKKKR